MLGTATINGTIRGISASDFPLEKYANAQSAWTTVRGLLYNRANSLFEYSFDDSPSLITRPVSKSVSYNQLAGVVNYSVVYTNALAPTDNDIATADVIVQNAPKSRIVAQQPIPGRLAGPIIQDIGTTTAYTRNVSINLKMAPKGSRAYWTFADITTPRAVASGYLSNSVSDLGVLNTDWFITNQNEAWDTKNGTYTTQYDITVR